MGYTTDFYGSVSVSPPLNEHEISYLRDFAETRRMHRTNGPFFVKGEGDFGQGDGPDEILNYNDPPPGQPGLWCQWTPGPDGSYIEWDQGEKFYNSAEWMDYIIKEFLSPSGKASYKRKFEADERFQHFTFDHVVNGEIEARGEDPSDHWMLVVENNRVSVASAVVTFDRSKAHTF
jgi:hypothetical protein